LILALVGTHEQPFDRLLRAVDELPTDQRRVVQTGHSAYAPDHCEAHAFLPFEEVKRLMSEASVVITHAGTGTVMLALSLGRKPVVVPRLRRFHEHVDDHQLQLVESLAEDGMVIPWLPGEDLSARVAEAQAATATRAIRPADALVEHLAGIVEHAAAATR